MILKKSPNFILSKQDKIKLIKLKFPDKKPPDDPIFSLINIEDNRSISNCNNQAKKAFLIREQKKKIYSENEVDLTITESDFHQYLNLTLEIIRLNMMMSMTIKLR